VERRQDVEPVVRDQVGPDAEQAGDHAAQWHDAVALADPEHRGVDVGGAGLEGGEGVGDGATGVVVGVELDIAVDRLADHRDQLEDLVGGGDANRVGKPDSLRVQSVDRLVDAQQVARFRAEGILAAESHLQPLGLDVPHHLGAGFDDLIDGLPMRKGAHGGRGAEQDVDSVRAGVDGNACVIQVAADVGQHLGPQRQGGDDSQVRFGLGGRAGRSQLQVLDAKLIEHLSDRNLLRGGEVGRDELFAFPKRRLDDLERLYGHGTSEKYKAYVHRDERPSVVGPPDFAVPSL